jgi:hypothetical protein
LAGLGLCASGVSVGVGCGGSTGGSPAGGGDGGSAGSPSDSCGSGTACVTPPAAPSTPTAASAWHNFAVHTLYLGDRPRGSSMPTDDAWKSFGYNLDNLVTTTSSTDVCTLAPMAERAVQEDGNGGIDNSFGANILPIIASTGGDVATTLNAELNGGTFTLMTYVKGLDDANPSQTATGLSGVLLSGADYTKLDAGAPGWNLQTHWPVAPDLLNCPNNTCPAGTDPVSAAKVQFPTAYVANGTFVNGSPSNVTLTLTVGGQSLTLIAHSAVITFDHKAPGSATNGTIAGVIDTTELLNAVHGIAGHISQSLCAGSVFDSIKAAIIEASDIVLHPDGSISNSAGETCNAISIGLGFDATEIAPPTANDIVGPTPPAPDPCADAGSE